MGWLFVKRRMMTELGNDWQKNLKVLKNNLVRQLHLDKFTKQLALMEKI
jgi:hypothetical protein